jgi:hypothetical protein
MSATFSTTKIAMTAYQSGAERMPSSLPAVCMCISAMAATTASITFIRTDVSASVSLFVLLLLVYFLLLVCVFISLLLTCLTRLVGLESLVGLTRELATNTLRGD